MFDWKDKRKERENKLAAENGRVEKVVEETMKMAEDERGNLERLNRLMDASLPRFYSKKTVRKLDEDWQYTEACLKYVMLDLEATRRERDYLGKCLDRAMDS